MSRYRLYNVEFNNKDSTTSSNSEKALLIDNNNKSANYVSLYKDFIIYR